jgi:phosphoglycolate phosphatase-like HAD superfamily hydrolase
VIADDGQQREALPPMAVLFDVDGTLYWQRGLRLRMARDLLLAAVVSSDARLDLRILQRFRADRETLAERVKSDFENAQYEKTAKNLGLGSERVREAVGRWIFQKPLRYLLRYRLEGLAEWLAELRNRGVLLGVYSEYPAEDKVAALGLSFDAVVASTDPEVDAFKPNPKGIQVLLSRLKVSPERTLFVGDRLDRDKPCATAAGVSFLHVGKGSDSAITSFPPPPHLLPEFLRQGIEV